MSTDAFLDDPWGRSDEAYEKSPFNIRPAPEFSTAEVALASLYRASGFDGYAETKVPKAGRDLDRLSNSARLRPNIPGRIKANTWHDILHGVLESPKRPNQSSKRFLSLNPLVPEVALYSGSARLAGNSWNPGALVKRMIQLGSLTRLSGEKVWSELHDALSVTDQDDIWARWLSAEFSEQGSANVNWAKTELGWDNDFPEIERASLQYPARQFVKDLSSVVQAKHKMTRRQWTSLIESILRIGVVSHTLWLCRVNDRLWHNVAMVIGIRDGNPIFDQEDIRQSILMVDKQTFMHGKAAVQTIKESASRYLSARLGLNLVLSILRDEGKLILTLQSIGDLSRFLKLVDSERDLLLAKGVRDSYSKLQDREIRTIGCKKGIGANLVEFGTYTLGQRQTSNDALRGYDQGYFLHKRSEARNAPWIFSLGPVAVLAIVHCCLQEVDGPRSIRRLAEHLSWYGIEIDLEGITTSDLGRHLRMLGLVLDSPDAESGMLLIPPFGRTV